MCRWRIDPQLKDAAMNVELNDGLRCIAAFDANRLFEFNAIDAIGESHAYGDRAALSRAHHGRAQIDVEKDVRSIFDRLSVHNERVFGLRRIRSVAEVFGEGGIIYAKWVARSMQKRNLGQSDLAVSSIGLGCMGMSQSYGKRDDVESLATLHRALDLGVTFFDTAEVYGPFHNEELLGKALRGRRDGIVVATKFGFKIDTTPGRHIGGVDGSPENVRRVADASLARLGIDTIDLFYQHRRDPNVPIEDTIGALADLVKAGKIRAIGLSEVGSATIRRAHAVHPIAALQSEYSLWERGLEAEILPTLRELGIALVPFSPLGRGFLTGAVTGNATLSDDDFRKNDPRFAAENADRNAEIVAAVRAVAARYAATPAQIALAWVLAQGDDIVPIPGTKRVKYLEENVGAAAIALSAADLTELGALASRTAGPRYNAAMMSMVER